MRMSYWILEPRSVEILDQSTRIILRNPLRFSINYILMAFPDLFWADLDLAS